VHLKVKYLAKSAFSDSFWNRSAWYQLLKDIFQVFFVNSREYCCLYPLMYRIENIFQGLSSPKMEELCKALKNDCTLNKKGHNLGFAGSLGCLSYLGSLG
jgi:hypothetical protein